MKTQVKPFTQFLNEAKSIEDLSKKDERPMVEGIAEILSGVRDKANRLELAKAQVRNFRRDGIKFDYDEFFSLCGL